MSKKKKAQAMPKVLFVTRVEDGDGGYWVCWDGADKLLDAAEEHGEQVGVYELRAVKRISIVRGLE